MSTASPSGFVHEEHTADLAIRAWGSTLGEAFAACARGVLAYMIELDAVSPRETREMRIQAENADHALFEFIEEVLFAVQTDLFLPSTFEVTGDPASGKMVVLARGEAYDAERHGHIHEIKAATFHEMSIRVDPPEVRIVVDI